MSDRRARLEALRERLSEEIEVADTRDLASLSREMRAVLAELDGLAAPNSGSATDEVAKRREERRRKASG